MANQSETVGGIVTDYLL